MRKQVYSNTLRKYHRAARLSNNLHTCNALGFWKFEEIPQETSTQKYFCPNYVEQPSLLTEATHILPSSVSSQSPFFLLTEYDSSKCPVLKAFVRVGTRGWQTIPELAWPTFPTFLVDRLSSCCFPWGDTGYHPPKPYKWYDAAHEYRLRPELWLPLVPWVLRECHPNSARGIPQHFEIAREHGGSIESFHGCILSLRARPSLDRLLGVWCCCCCCWESLCQSLPPPLHLHHSGVRETMGKSEWWYKEHGKKHTDSTIQSLPYVHSFDQSFDAGAGTASSILHWHLPCTWSKLRGDCDSIS